MYISERERLEVGLKYFGIVLNSDGVIDGNLYNTDTLNKFNKYCVAYNLKVITEFVAFSSPPALYKKDCLGNWILER